MEITKQQLSDISKIEDDYDLIATIGRILNGYRLSDIKKEAIKDIARGCYESGYKQGAKDERNK